MHNHNGHITREKPIVSLKDGTKLFFFIKYMNGLRFLPHFLVKTTLTRLFVLQLSNPIKFRRFYLGIFLRDLESGTLCAAPMRKGFFRAHDFVPK